MTSFKALNSKKFTKAAQIQTPDSLYWKKLSVSNWICMRNLTSQLSLTAMNFLLNFLSVSRIGQRIRWYRLH